MKKFTWPAELTLTLIGGKWKALILHHLLEGESRRFGELRRLLPGISAKMLAKHLKELEVDGLITRMETAPAHHGGVTRIFYTPTNRSRSLAPILSAIQAWGREHLVDYEAGGIRPSAEPPDRSPAEPPATSLSPRPSPLPR